MDNHNRVLRESTTGVLVLQLLQSKKQIILYGPPGTGKTYSTKRIAVSLMDGFDYINDLKEYDELPDTEPDRPKKIANSPLFNKIESSIKNLSGIEAKPGDSMIGYYSFSKKMNKKKGLVWLDYPEKTGSFRVHLRKEIEDFKYPQEIVNQMKNYKTKDFGNYPSFMVKSDEDADKAIALIKYAYENL